MNSFRQQVSQYGYHMLEKSIEDLNPNFLKAYYAVRGKVPATAAKIQAEIEKGVKYPFHQITELNLTNPQMCGQLPITFNRQVAASIIDSSYSKVQSNDVQRRAKHYKETIRMPIGAYSISSGYPTIREDIAKFIQKRDQTKSKPNFEDIILIDGASQGIALMFNLILSKCNDGVMIPIPQYPLFSAVIDQCGAVRVPYYLDEESGWSVSRLELTKQYEEAIKKGINPKVFVCINPGNPTASVYNKESISEMIKFATEKNMAIFADEVYQENTYNPIKKFISFRKVAEELNLNTELYSFHSISKGIYGECGLKGGYMEMPQNLDPKVKAEIIKAKTIMFCANTLGQIMTGLMVTPPTAEEGCSTETIEQYQAERYNLFNSLKQRASIVSEYLNKTKGIFCHPIEGAMCAFPRINLSDKYVNYAKSQGYVPDELYCLELLKDTGIVVVPGSGFLQYPGTHHFRMTTLVLPNEKLLEKMDVFKQWHENYINNF